MKRFLSVLLVLIFMLNICCVSLAASDGNSGSIIDKKELDSLISELFTSMNVSGLDISVAYTYVATGDTYSFNGDHWYNGAGLYNIPLMIMVEDGKGTEKIKELDKRMDLDTVISACLIKSNLSYYNNVQEFLYNSFRDYRQAELDLINWQNTSNRNYYYTSEYSSEMINEYLTLLVNDQDKYSDIISAMKDCKTNLYFHNSELANKYPIAQKNGSDDASAHCAGIIFTENPILVTVMASGIRDSFANGFFGKLADLFVKYTLEKADPAYAVLLENGGSSESITEEVEDIKVEEIEEIIDEVPNLNTEPAEPTENTIEETIEETVIEEAAISETTEQAPQIEDEDTEVQPETEKAETSSSVVESHPAPIPRPDPRSRNVSLIIFGAIGIGSLAIAVIIIILLRSVRNDDDDIDDDEDEYYDDEDEEEDEEDDDEYNIF